MALSIRTATEIRLEACVDRRQVDEPWLGPSGKSRLWNPNCELPGLESRQVHATRLVLKDFWTATEEPVNTNFFHGPIAKLQGGRRCE